MDVRLCFFGDSLTAGVGDPEALGWVGRLVAQAQAEGLDVTGYNLGIRRETGPEITARLATEGTIRLRDGDVRGVVLSSGVNDTTADGDRQRESSAASLAALASAIKLCDSRGWALLVVGPPLVLDVAQSERILRLSSGQHALCGRHAVPFVEVAAMLGEHEGWLQELAAGDGAHPGGPGYQKLTEIIAPPWMQWLTDLAGAT